MKKWTILAIFCILYALGMYFFFRNQQKANAPSGDSATPASSPPASSAPQARPADREGRIVVRRIGDGTTDKPLPFEAIAESFLRYAGLGDVIPKGGPLIEITTKESAPEGRPLVFKGSIQLMVPGKTPLQVAFDHSSAPGEPGAQPSSRVPSKSEALLEAFQRGYVAKMAVLAGQAAGSTCLIPALSDAQLSVRRGAEQGLLALAASEATNALLAEQMAELLASPDPLVRDLAVRVLGAMADPRIVPLLVELLKDSSPLVRASALQALGSMADPRVLEPAIQAVRDEDPEVRRQAAVALGRLGDVRAVPALIALLEDDAEPVQQAVVEALRLLKDPTVPAQLLALPPGKPTRLKPLIKALGNAGDPRAIPLLASAVTNSQADVRDSAVQALGKLRDPGALAPLIQALVDEDIFVRSSAVASLEGLPDRRTVDALIQALDDEPLVRISAAMVLARMTRQNHGQEAGAWKAWWEKASQPGEPALPFEREAPVFQAPPVAEDPAAPIQWPQLHLAGVLRGTNRRPGAAVLNSRIVREGDYVEGVWLVEVGEDFVRLKNRDQARILKVHEILRE